MLGPLGLQSSRRPGACRAAASGRIPGWASLLPHEYAQGRHVSTRPSSDIYIYIYMYIYACIYTYMPHTVPECVDTKRCKLVIFLDQTHLLHGGSLPLVEAIEGLGITLAEGSKYQ